MVAEKVPEFMKSSDSGSTNSDGKKEKKFIPDTLHETAEHLSQKITLKTTR